MFFVKVIVIYVLKFFIKVCLKSFGFLINLGLVIK